MRFISAIIGVQMLFLAILMHLRYLHGTADIAWAMQGWGHPRALKGSTRKLQSHNWIPPPQHLPCTSTRALSFTTCSIQCISFVIPIFLWPKKPCKISSDAMKRYVYSQMGINCPSVKATLSKQVPSQPGLLRQSLDRPGQVAVRAEPSNPILWDKQVILMPLTMPCFIQCMSSILPLALTGRAPRHHRFCFVYSTFKDKAWCYGGPVYISAGLEAKM